MIAISVGIAALAVGAFGPAPGLLAAFAVAAVAPPLWATDVAEHRLPNRLTGPAILAGLAGLAVSWLAGASPVVPLAAGAVLGSVFLVLAFAGGMGLGDVKLAVALGLASPTLEVAVLSPLLAFLFGGVASIVVLVRRGTRARQDHIPFGPFLLAGYVGALAVVAVLRHWV